MVSSENNGAAGKFKGSQGVQEYGGAEVGTAAKMKQSSAGPGDNRAKNGCGVPKLSFKLKIEMAVENEGETRGKILCVEPNLGGREPTTQGKTVRSLYIDLITKTGATILSECGADNSKSRVGVVERFQSEKWVYQKPPYIVKASHYYTASYDKPRPPTSSLLNKSLV